MALYEQLPGSLSLSIVSGDQWSTVVDFDINMTSYTVSSEIYSLVDGAPVTPVTRLLMRKVFAMFYLLLKISPVSDGCLWMITPL